MIRYARPSHAPSPQVFDAPAGSPKEMVGVVRGVYRGAPMVAWHDLDGQLVGAAPRRQLRTFAEWVAEDPGDRALLAVVDSRVGRLHHRVSDRLVSAVRLLGPPPSWALSTCRGIAVPRRCGALLLNGQRCRRRPPAGAQVCAWHQREANRSLVGQPIEVGPCRMVQHRPGDWRCEVHGSPEWSVAQACGVQVPCRLPLLLEDRRALTRWVNLPASTVLLLARDPDARVRRRIAEHPALPASALDRLADDRDPWPRWGAARNPGATGALIRRLAGDSDRWVRRAAVTHPLCPDDAVVAAMHDPDELVAGGALAIARERRLVELDR